MDDICCIGHITLDKIVTPRKTTYMPGGTSYYFSHGISHLKDTKHYQLVTAISDLTIFILLYDKITNSRADSK